MKDKLVAVFVDGGLVSDHYAPKGVDVYVVDRDNLESGQCPVCWEEDIEIRDGERSVSTIMVAETRIRIDNSGSYPIPVESTTGKQVPMEVTDIRGGYTYCPHCDINWDEITDEEIIARLAEKYDLISPLDV